MTTNIEKEWAIVDAGDQILHRAETKLEVLEWAWEHDKSPIHHDITALPKNHPGPIL